jgi:hypothetical protein
MTERDSGEIRVNGRSYRKPAAPTVVVCYDGCDPRYISHGVLAGLFPNISRIPITDPFVKHHGALGSFVRVYATGSVPAQRLMDAAARIPGVALVLDGESTQRADLLVACDGIRSTVRGQIAPEVQPV